MAESFNSLLSVFDSLIGSQLISMKCTNQLLILNWSIINIFTLKLCEDIVRIIKSFQKYSIITIEIRCELDEDNYINKFNFILISDRSLEFVYCRVINSLFNVISESPVILCLKPDLMILMGELLAIVY